MWKRNKYDGREFETTEHINKYRIRNDRCEIGSRNNLSCTDWLAKLIKKMSGIFFARRIIVRMKGKLSV